MTDKIIKKVKDINRVTMENIEQMYPWADFIDKAIIYSILSSSKSMSHNTLNRKFMNEIKFFERLENITKRCPEIKQWQQEKPTLQVGNKELYKQYLENKE